MARSCGVRIGPRRFELVVLDGGPKRHKILAYRAGEFPVGGEDPAANAVAALKEAARTHRIPRENVGLVIDSGHAAFRRHSLPITDRAKIDQVIKYEVEGLLPQWNIDDVIVDFMILAEDERTSEVLVSAVPKSEISAALSLCQAAGFEPLEVELEATAMVNAALAADICHVDDAQLLVHVGEQSTSVVVMDAGEVREMRVIHMGAMTYDPGPRAPAVPPEELGVGTEPVALEELPELENPEDPDVARRIDQAIKRIRRELGRTLSGARTVNVIDSIYVCGIELPGLVGSTVQDVPIYVLDCFEEDGGQPADGFGALVVAYGAALRQLGGGVLRPSLRREEVRFTGTFERVEFPLAVLCLVLCTFLGVINILQYRELQFQERAGTVWLRSALFNAVGDPAQGRRGTLSPPPDDVRDYAKRFDGKEFPGDPERTPEQSLDYVLSMVSDKILALQRELGKDSEITQPQSAFVGAVLVLGVLEGNSDWRPSLRNVKSTYQLGTAGRPDSVRVTLDLTFFADSSLEATRHYEAFQAALRQHPWFVSFEEKKSDSIDGGRGIAISGLPITVDPSQYFESADAQRVAAGG